MSIQNNYESVLVFSANDGEEGAQQLLEKFKGLVEQHGTLVKVDEWGKRRLAYEIDDQTEGYYYLLTLTADADFPTEFDRVLNITDGVLRSLIIKKD